MEKEKIAFTSNPDVEDFDKRMEYEREIEPLVKQLHEKLKEHGISGFFTAVPYVKRQAPQGTSAGVIQARGTVVFHGPSKTPSELVAGYLFSHQGLGEGLRFLAAFFAKQGADSPLDFLATVHKLMETEGVASDPEEPASSKIH